MNEQLSASTILSAFAEAAFLPANMSEAGADETSELFDQQLVVDTCVKCGSAEPQKRIEACLEVIKAAKLTTPEMASVAPRPPRPSTTRPLGKPTLAFVEYDAALKLDLKCALALYGRGLVRIGTGDPKDGAADCAAATLLVPEVGQQFVLNGLDK